MYVYFLVSDVYIYTCIYICIHAHTYTHADRQTDRQKDRQTYRNKTGRHKNNSLLFLHKQ